jgi:hypothetical protein
MEEGMYIFCGLLAVSLRAAMRTFLKIRESSMQMDKTKYLNE